MTKKECSIGLRYEW